MSWTAPRTWVTGEIVSASQLNTHLRDNTIDLDRRTTSTAATVATSQTTASASYTDLATTGPAVTVTIGLTGLALVSMYTHIGNSGASGTSAAAFAVSGATTVAAADTAAVIAKVISGGDSLSNGLTKLVASLNAGSNTFTMKYKAASGTASFANRHIIVTPLGS